MGSKQLGSKFFYRSQICSYTPSALNAGAKRSGATCHMAMPQYCYLAKEAKRPSHTTNTIKFDRDNEPTMRAVAKKLVRPMIGCGSHRLSLAVKHWLVQNDQGVLLEKVNCLMKKLSNLKQAGNLRKKYYLKPVTRNITRWSSNYYMLHRYHELTPFLEELIDTSPSEELKLQDLPVDLTDIQSVTLKLQEDSITFAEVRRKFDALILRFYSMCKYLSERAEIVDYPQLEAAIVKLFTVPYEDLKLAEKVHLGRFSTQQEGSHSNADVETGHKSFAETVLLSSEPVPALKTMMKLHWVPPTSNIVERLFSKAKNIRAPLRNRILPVNFEENLYLAVNKNYWDVETLLLVLNSD